MEIRGNRAACRRRLARPAPRHRRRARDGHGPRDPHRALQRPPGAVLHRLRQALYRPAVPDHARTGRRRLAGGQVLTAADLGEHSEHAGFKPAVLDEPSGTPRIPNGSLGFRWGPEGAGRWNLDLEGIQPLLTLLGRAGTSPVPVLLPRFDTGPTEGGSVMRRGVPAVSVGGHQVTTVFDLLLAQYGVHRDGLPGDWPAAYDDASQPGTPAWAEEITSVPARLTARIAREFARNAERTRCRR